MGQGHRWEFKRRDNHFDSSGSEHESSSSLEPAIKKQKKVFSLMPSKIDEAEDVKGLQWKSRYAPLSEGQLQAEKSNNMKIGTSMKEDDRMYVGKNGEGKSCESTTLEDTRIFMESILEELKVARDKMLVWMRTEIQKMMDEDPNPESTRESDNYKHEIKAAMKQNSFTSGSDVQNCTAGTFVESVKCTRAVCSPTSNEMLEDQAEYCLNTPPMEPEGQMLTSSCKGSLSPISPDQVGSSMYLSLPTALPEPHLANVRFSSLRNYVSTSKEFLNICKGNPTPDSRVCGGSSPRGLNGEKFKNVPSIGSQSVGYIRQSKLASSYLGFPVSFRRDFRIQAQARMQNLSQFKDNISGMPMIRDKRADIEDQLFVGNNLCNQESHNGNIDAWTHGNLISGSQTGLVMQELLYQE